MPEGAEYVKLSKDLSPWVGKKITRIEPLWKGYEKFAKIPSSWSQFESKLLGRTITDIFPYGKNLWVVLEGSAYWRIHLGSTGWIDPVGRVGNPLKEHFLHTVEPAVARLIFHLSDESAYRYLDARTWGKFYFYEGVPLRLLQANATGPSWLHDNGLAWENLVGHTGNRRAKDVLCDQKIAAGVGNYVSCEALFRAGVHPHQRWKAVSLEKRRLVAAKIILVLDQSVEADDHEHWMVFGRRDEQCLICETIIKYVKDVGGDRGSYFCPSCQKL